MRAKQREASLMVLQLLNGDLPPLDGVALRAIRPHLFRVHIGVAVLAILSYVGKNGLHMTLRAFHLLVHAAQGILSFVVIELRVGPDRTPRGGGMAVFTGDR